MNPIRPALSAVPPMAAALLAAGLLLAGPSQAQGVYRIVGPDGRVTFSDQPPPSGTASTSPANRAAAPGSAAGGAGAQLPYELRQVSNRYPVTLYASQNCAPCDRGRSLLDARGVPYTEKTVDTPQDGDALRRLSGEMSLPFLTIGGQQIKGYSDTEWTRFLDAAGYPKQSALPPGYRRPAPSPLVAVQTEDAVAVPPASAAQPQPQPQPPAPTPVAPPAQNPAGIRF